MIAQIDSPLNETQTKDDPRLDSLLPDLHGGVHIQRMGPNAYTVRDSVTRTYFQAGDQEAFLLQNLREPITWHRLSDEFHRTFGEELQRSDLDDFLSVLRERRLLRESLGTSSNKTKSNTAAVNEEELEEQSGRGGSLLFYRLPLSDPDRMLAAFTRAFPFLWTKAFLLAACGLMLISGLIMFGNYADLKATFTSVLQPRSAVIALIVVVTATALHEMGHGATCKRFGGSVHESGLLILFFMPCLYVNVSDAWCIPDRWKRLAVTFAGGFVDMCLWAIAVVLWRVTRLDSIVNHVAFILLTTCGTRSLLNFNPLLRLDGYYLLCDIINYPNLYTTARRYWADMLTWALWGARRPKPPDRPWLVLLYGLNIWLFAIAFLNYIGWKLIALAGSSFGIIGGAIAVIMFLYGLRRVLRGFISNEMLTMIKTRFVRTSLWIAGIAMVALGAAWLRVSNYAVGEFEVRSARRTEIAGPMHSFIASVCVHEGQRVEVGDVLLTLHAPELASTIAAKRFELEQTEAALGKLQNGARPEEIEAAETKVGQLTEWSRLGDSEVASARGALQAQLTSLSHRVEQIELQISLAETVLNKSEELRSKGAVSGAQVTQEKSKLAILRSQLSETKAAYESREKDGVRIEIAEAARRKQQLTEAQSQLKLLQIGSRIEEIESERAKRNRLKTELDFLVEREKQLTVRATAAGLVSAPRLRERVGEFVPQGSILCHIEDPDAVQIEIFVSEDDAAAVKAGQTVRLKARSLPFETFDAKVERVSTAAMKPYGSVALQKPATQQSVIVYCSLPENTGMLKTGMTGSGRILNGDCRVAMFLLAKCYRHLRTEFWW
ncbi:MAG: efflux RND transporter periplasmic adaptor subunit [Pirellulales bacterium]